MESEYAIVGGGVVGLSVAYGLLKLGKSVSVFDEGDGAFRASRGNFGLVWVQGKGISEPDYARWTIRSASHWQSFADELGETTGNKIRLVQDGGYSYYQDEASLAEAVSQYQTLKKELGGEYEFDVLGHNALREEEPNIGPSVFGAILHHSDGHANPLLLLQSLSAAVRQAGAVVHTNTCVKSAVPIQNGFDLDLHSLGEGGRTGRTSASRIVLCAGLGTSTLGPMLGFKAPIRAQRGQILITEKMPSIMNRPSDVIRQVDEGGVQIGASAEEVGADDQETLDITAQLARDAIALYPCLEKTNLIRSWAALRIMSPDGLPIYQQSHEYPGAYFVTCHSGITLAAAHSQYLPLWITGDINAPDLNTFSEDRF